MNFQHIIRPENIHAGSAPILALDFAAIGL